MDGTAVVTGAGSGTGEAVARALAGEGATVVVSGRDEEPTAATVEAIAAAGGTATARTADLRDELDVEWLMETAARFGSPGIDLVVAAGEVRHDPPEDAPFSGDSYAAFDDHVRTNARGAFATVREALPHLADGARALVATHPSARTPGGAGTYAVSKAATEAVARGLAADADVPVGCVDPGADPDPEAAADLFLAAARLEADRLDGSVITPDDVGE